MRPHSKRSPKPLSNGLFSYARAVTDTSLASASNNRITALFAVTSFMTAALIFTVEPMVAKLVLPSFGGSAAVWNVSVTFFQVSLLLAYAYAHGSWHRLKHRQPFLHIVLITLPLLTLPLALPGWAVPSSSASPTLWLVLVLLVTIGATFTALATSSPLLQAWFSSTTHRRAREPLFLYATGNIGSFVGLLSYPFVIEPLFTLRQQTVGWSIAYGLAVLLVVACAIVTRRTRSTVVAAAVAPTETETDVITWKRRLNWVLIAAVPSSLMLGVTTYIATDIGSIPLLWVIPLSIYLLTFVVALGARAARQCALSAP